MKTLTSLTSLIAATLLLSPLNSAHADECVAISGTKLVSVAAYVAIVQAKNPSCLITRTEHEGVPCHCHQNSEAGVTCAGWTVLEDCLGGNITVVTSCPNEQTCQ